MIMKSEVDLETEMILKGRLIVRQLIMNEDDLHSDSLSVDLEIADDPLC